MFVLLENRTIAVICKRHFSSLIYSVAKRIIMTNLLNIIVKRMFIQYYVNHCWKMVSSTVTGGGAYEGDNYSSHCVLLFHSQNLVTLTKKCETNNLQSYIVHTGFEENPLRIICNNCVRIWTKQKDGTLHLDRNIYLANRVSKNSNNDM
jgi:hypothetical protein